MHATRLWMACITTQLSLDLHVSSNFFMTWHLTISKKPIILPGKYILIKENLNLSKSFLSSHYTEAFQKEWNHWSVVSSCGIQISVLWQPSVWIIPFNDTIYNLAFTACLAFDKCWFHNLLKWSKRLSRYCHIFCVYFLFISTFPSLCVFMSIRLALRTSFWGSLILCSL